MEEKNKQTKQERLDAMHNKEKVKKEIFTVLIIVGILIGFYFLMSNSNNKFNKSNLNVDSKDLPTSGIHWHPNLKIKIDGKLIKIPNDIGLNPGAHSPMHTHEEGDGTLHLENSNPSANPESMALGFFFNTWKKPFNSTCILDKCTNVNGGELHMYVNGKENYDFENYVFKGEEKILIEYTSSNLTKK